MTDINMGNIDISEEMITYPMFYRSYVVRRPGDFSKIHDLKDLKELPVGSVLHTNFGIDGNYGKTATPTPNMKHYTHYLGKKKLNLFFVRRYPNKNDAVQPNLTAMRQVLAGVDQKIREFRNTNLSRFFLKNDLNEFTNSNMFQNVICHDPIYRSIVTGILRHRRVFDLGLASVMNHAITLPESQHFVVFNTSEMKLSKPDFLRTFKEYSRVTIKHQDSTYYLAVMHLLGFMHEHPTESLFEQVPENMLSNMNIVFQNNGKFIIYNLATLKDMYTRTPAVALQFLFQLNHLALTPAQVKVLEKEHAKELVPEETGNPVEAKEIVVKKEPEISVIKKDKHNATEFRETVKPEEEVKHAKEKIIEQDKAIDEKLAEDTTKTEAKKKYTKEITTKYKEVVVDNKPVEKILVEKVDKNLKKNEVAEQVTKDLPDKSITVSSVAKFSNEYMEKTYKKDMVSNLVSLRKGGMYLQDIKEEDTSDSLTRKITYTSVFKDENGRQHTVKFTLPKVDESGNCFINGSHKRMNLQRINTPICKVSPTRVSLSSNFNKTIVQRNESFSNTLPIYVKKMLVKAGDQVTLDIGRNNYKDVKLPYDYTAIASVFNGIKHKKFNWTYKLEERLDGMSEEEQKAVRKLEAKYGVYFGLTEKKKTFVNFTGVVTVYTNDKDTFSTTVLDLLKQYVDAPFPPFKEWVNFHILNIKLPVIFVLCYKYGLTEMLDYLHVKYEFVDGNIKGPVPLSDITVKFKDGTLRLRNMTTFGRLMFSGLNDIKHREIEFKDMDVKDTYFDLIQSKKLSINYLKGIDDMFDLFVDPITEDVLKQMGEPTNLRDLLIRAVVLLTTDDCKEASSSTNFRYRSYEQFNAVVYKQLTRALSNYKNKPKGGIHKFSISEFEIYGAISTDPLLTNIDILNPIGDIGAKHRFSHIGDGGRTGESMTIADRRYADDSVGILSEASVASGGIGIDGTLSVDSNVVNVRGMTVNKKHEDLTPAEILSPVSMLLPGLDFDDGKRMNFVSMQISQYVPTQHKDMARLRTGYERVVAQRSQPPFAYIATDDGKVLDVNLDTETLTVQYKKAGLYTVSFRQEFSKNGGGGFYVTQNMALNTSPGSIFKKGDVLVYNSDFFIKDVNDGAIDLSIGVFANVAFLEGAGQNEDGSVISEDLAKKLSFNPVQVRKLSIKRNTVIHKVAKPGTFVKSIDPIMIFDESDISSMEYKDKDMLDIISALNKSTPKAKYSGTIVKIEAFYKSEISEMNDSVRKFINSINRVNKARHTHASNSKNSYEFNKPGSITNDKIDGQLLDEETIMLKFYIQQDLSMIAGDKLVYDGALKSIISTVMEKESTSEDGTVVVDAMMSAMAINNRMVLSPLFSGAFENILKGVEDNAVDMYFN